MRGFSKIFTRFRLRYWNMKRAICTRSEHHCQRIHGPQSLNLKTPLSGSNKLWVCDQVKHYKSNILLIEVYMVQEPELQCGSQTETKKKPWAVLQYIRS